MTPGERDDLLHEIERLRAVLSPSASRPSSGEYKHGWTNGKKFALQRVEDYVKRIPTSEPKEEQHESN